MAGVGLITPFTRSLLFPVAVRASSKRTTWRTVIKSLPVASAVKFFSTSVTAREMAESVSDFSFDKPKSSHSTVIVEGNIGSGKAQLLSYFATFPSVEVCEEPIDLWRNKDGLNLLDLMYKDPKANSFVFQQYVLETMANLQKRGLEKPVTLLERSFYSARYIFVENLKRNGLLTDAEYAQLDEQFKSYLTEKKNTKVDLIVYIRTDPKIAHERILKRGRAEEMSISVDYLVQLHNRYEEWLCEGKFPIPAPIMVIDGNVSINDVREELRKRKDEILFGWAFPPPDACPLPPQRPPLPSPKKAILS